MVLRVLVLGVISFSDFFLKFLEYLNVFHPVHQSLLVTNEIRFLRSISRDFSRIIEYSEVPDSFF